MKSLDNSVHAVIKTTDMLVYFFIYSLFCLSVLGSKRLPDWEMHALNLFLTGIVYFGLSLLSRYLEHGLFSFSLRVILIVSLCSHLFQAVGPLQHVLFERWFDDILISLEVQLTGTETSIFLQKITSPIVTEWMMFCYVIYVLLLPVTAFLCFRHAGRIGGERYLLNLVTVNIICFSGFITFPVASPLFYMPEIYTVPLEGGIFTWCGEWIRANQHYPGGALPSPHAAAGSIMLFAVYRYAHRYAFIYLPIVFTIYIATVYGRYHYIWDVFTGILAAVLVLRAIPSVIIIMTRFEGQLQKKFFVTKNLLKQERSWS